MFVLGSTTFVVVRESAVTQLSPCTPAPATSWSSTTAASQKCPFVLLATFKAEANGFVVVKSTLEHHCTPAANSSAIRHKGFMTKHTVSKTDIGVLTDGHTILSSMVWPYFYPYYGHSMVSPNRVLYGQSMAIVWAKYGQSMGKFG